MLLQQFGGVPLVLEASRDIRTDFPRATAAEVYQAIIADLIYAKNNLTAIAPQPGRARSGAARHYLAKVYLTRGSAVSAAAKTERGTQSTDLDSTITHSTEIINNLSKYNNALEADYMNLWNGVYPNGYPNVITPTAGTNGTAPVGDYTKIKASNSSKEIILAAQFINDPFVNGQNAGGTNIGNRVHEYFIMQYDSGIPRLVRDQFNGRPFRRMGPSDYTIDLFDRRYDSRFYKSFRTAYYSNRGNNLPKFGIGDTAVLFIVNDRTNPILESDLSKYRYRAYARWTQNHSNRSRSKRIYHQQIPHID